MNLLSYEKRKKEETLSRKNVRTIILGVIESFELLHPGLTSQRHSALISSDSEEFQVCFSAVHYLKISETALFSSETALNFPVLNSADSEKIRADQR